MKLSPYMNIKRVEFVITYRCSGKCGHCSLGDKLNRADGGGHISGETAADALEQLSKLYDIQSVMTFGGEPLLYPDDVCVIHDRARSCGIDVRQLITNGYFTRDDGKIHSVAGRLRTSGVNNILVSADAFHQESIPIEYVRSFIKYLAETGTKGLKIHPAWVVNREHDNAYNSRTKEILRQFDDLNVEVSNGNNIFMAGRAADTLSEYYDKPSLNPRDACGTMPYTEPLTEITSLSIAPDGSVRVCGFTIGNIYKQSAEEIIAGYNPYKNEWMSCLISGGAAALSTLAKEKGIDIGMDGCYSVCDLCRKITGFINA